MSEYENTAFINRVETNNLRIAVIGLGYVGLPLAVALSEIGFIVTGVDKNRALIESLRKGVSHIEAVSRERLEAAHLQLMPRVDGGGPYDVYVICVPTPLDEFRRPDLGAVRGAAEDIQQSLKDSQFPQHPKLVVLESTVWPGATRDVVAAQISAPNTFFAFAPERENPGDATFNTRTIPRVVGADNDRAREMAVAFYSRLTTVHPVSSTKVAETAKLLENIYRLVNIALINELRENLHVLGIDIREVIEAAATKPFGFQAFWPGPGIGGHCIPIDPFYLSHVLRGVGRSASIIEAAGEVDARTPDYVVRRVSDELNKSHGLSLANVTVCVVGVSYKPNVADARETPAVKIMELLADRRCALSFHDPLVPTLRVASHVWVSQETHESSVLIIVSDHDCLDYRGMIREGVIIFDTRGAFRKRGIRHPSIVEI